MQHFYIREKVKSHPAPPSPKAFATALFFILLITVYFGAKSFIQNRDQEYSETDITQEQTNPIDTYSPEFFPVEKIYQVFNDKNYQLVDVRNEESWQKKHIENSTNIPANLLNQRFTQLDKNKTIILINQKSDDEAKSIGANLSESGYNVKILDGGFEKYYFENYPVISGGDPSSISDKIKTRPVSSHELLEKINQGQRFVFLDTRPKSDFDKSHIEESINIPLEDIETRKSDLPAGKILVCDEDPSRSFQAAVKLYDMNVWTAYYLSDSLSKLRNETKTSN